MVEWVENDIRDRQTKYDVYRVHFHQLDPGCMEFINVGCERFIIVYTDIRVAQTCEDTSERCE